MTAFSALFMIKFYKKIKFSEFDSKCKNLKRLMLPTVIEKVKKKKLVKEKKMFTPIGVRELRISTTQNFTSHQNSEMLFLLQRTMAGHLLLIFLRKHIQKRSGKINMSIYF